MTHTFDIFINYHSCPECKYILENRKPYVYRLGKYYLDLECPRCGHGFEVESPRKPKFGPLLNDR